MQLRSVLARDWKTAIKTILGTFSLFAIVLILPVTTEAATEWKNATIRASDGHVYEIQYATQLSPENFWVSRSDGEMPSHEIAAKLYIAAFILNRPSTAVDIYILQQWIYTTAMTCGNWFMKNAYIQPNLTAITTSLQLLGVSL